MATADTYGTVRSGACAFCHLTYAYPARLERTILHKYWRDGRSEHAVMVGRHIIHHCSTDADACTSA